MSRQISITTTTAATVVTTVKRTATRLTIDNDPIAGLALIIGYSDVSFTVTTPASGPSVTEVIDVFPVEAVRVPGSQLAALPCFAATSTDLAALADAVSVEKWPDLTQP